MQENNPQALRCLAFLVIHVLALAAIGFASSAVGYGWDLKIQSDGSHMRMVSIQDTGNQQPALLQPVQRSHPSNTPISFERP